MARSQIDVLHLVADINGEDFFGETRPEIAHQKRVVFDILRSAVLPRCRVDFRRKLPVEINAVEVVLFHRRPQRVQKLRPRLFRCRRLAKICAAHAADKQRNFKLGKTLPERNDVGKFFLRHNFKRKVFVYARGSEDYLVDKLGIRYAFDLRIIVRKKMRYEQGRIFRRKTRQRRCARGNQNGDFFRRKLHSVVLFYLPILPERPTACKPLKTDSFF